ncbi:hypothetical protein [Modestobacter muralis]|uniref:hypothetical protein n=1 Tax=Modestobacter muralis TaxID=1608614 RepID=UPI001B8D2E39|nr:hypothetical protein [Modestobacter muralis]
MGSLGEQWFDHRLATVVSAGDRRRMTALPRGRHRGHRLVCGECSMVLAWDHCPWEPPAPLLMCNRCHAINDLTRSVGALTLPT